MTLHTSRSPTNAASGCSRHCLVARGSPPLVYRQLLGKYISLQDRLHCSECTYTDPSLWTLDFVGAWFCAAALSFVPIALYLSCYICTTHLSRSYLGIRQRQSIHKESFMRRLVYTLSQEIFQLSMWVHGREIFQQRTAPSPTNIFFLPQQIYFFCLSKYVWLTMEMNVQTNLGRPSQRKVTKLRIASKNVL